MGWLTSAALRESKLLKKLLGLSSYQLDSNGNVIGFLDASGLPMKSKAVTWTEFLTLGSGDVQDISAVWVYDKQCMFVWNDLAARWYLVGGRLTFATFDLAPLPAANILGLRVWVESGIGIGGAWIEVRLIGSTYLWRYVSGRAVLKFRSSDISKTTNKTTEEALEGFKLVRNNGKNIMQDNDVLFLVQHASKSGTANNFGRDFRVGPNGPGASILSDAASGDAVATGSVTNISDDEAHRFKRLSATSMKRLGPKFSISTVGFAATVRSTAFTVANMDNADTYFSSTFYLSGGTADTQTLEDWYLELIHTGG